MVRVGEAPFLECSSRGETRFSPFFARPASLQGRSIEDAYQNMKVFEDGSTNLGWKAAQRRKPVNLEECQTAYKDWWREWIIQEDLIDRLIRQTGLSDRFGRPGSTCQATTLWELRAEFML